MHKFIDPHWLQWFIGFTEGDGGFYTPFFLFFSPLREALSLPFLFFLTEKS